MDPRQRVSSRFHHYVHALRGDERLASSVTCVVPNFSAWEKDLAEVLSSSQPVSRSAWRARGMERSASAITCMPGGRVSLGEEHRAELPRPNESDPNRLPFGGSTLQKSI